MIIEDSMVSLAKRYTKLEFHEKTKRYYGTCPFCHSGADMFCADNKNGVFWCYACGKHGNMDDFKILMGQEKPEMPQELDDEELQTIYEAAAIFYFRYLIQKHSGISRKRENCRKTHFPHSGSVTPRRKTRYCINICRNAFPNSRSMLPDWSNMGRTDSRMTCFATASCSRS